MPVFLVYWLHGHCVVASRTVHSPTHIHTHAHIHTLSHTHTYIHKHTYSHTHAARRVHIPEIFHDKSSPRVLTMEFVQGGMCEWVHTVMRVCVILWLGYAWVHTVMRVCVILWLGYVWVHTVMKDCDYLIRVCVSAHCHEGLWLIDQGMCGCTLWRVDTPYNLVCQAAPWFWSRPHI